jgi:L-alanine-DL-glutamate epimerase-like enolase superfamily enzyme
MSRRISVRTETWPSLIPFRIANITFDDFPLIVCEIEEDGTIGRGEALGVYFFDETPATMTAEIEAIAHKLADGAGREDLLDLLPPGGARFAVDSALWDLEAQLSNESVWAACGVDESPVETVFTIGLESEPREMADRATAARDYTLLKVKLDADRPVERIAAIRAVRPDARIIIDANQGWCFDQLVAVAPKLRELGVLMIEQPLPRGGDAELEDYDAPLPLCADESCLHLGELAQAMRRYQVINIKLDKTGGLTHALRLAKAARNLGLDLMVGCMGGTSLSMAPSHVLAQLCSFVDIDGPLLIGDDRPDGLLYEHAIVSVPAQRFWGLPARGLSG